ncbi:MAG: hypothetical protein M1335_03805 [Chloroflexi bacterium]|nr:hypothetical protein [Chloroflexota bacterium]
MAEKTKNLVGNLFPTRFFYQSGSDGRWAAGGKTGLKSSDAAAPAGDG